MIKAYSYLRFSTPEQSSGDSFRRQIEAARSYAAESGLDLDESSYQDLGLSGFDGSNARRGALGKFLQAVDNGLIEPGSYLLIENLDRMSRQNPWEALPLFQLIINAGIVIVTVQDRRVWSKEEMKANPYRIMESLVVMIRANEESATKSRRLTAVWRKKRSQASSVKMTARAPAWLNLGSDRSFTVDEGRAAIVRDIFEDASKGIGEHSIAVALNRRQVPVFGSGGLWHRTYISKILSNPAVVGILVPHTISRVNGRKVRTPQEQVADYFPPVVDPALYSTVQAMRSAARNPRRGRHAQREIQNVLGGLAKCAACGSTMTRSTKGARSKPSLICTKAKSGSGCAYKPLHMDIVESTLQEYARTDDPKMYEPGIRVIESSLGHARYEEEKLSQQIRRIVSLIAGGNKSDALVEKLDELESALAWVRDKRSKIEARLGQIDRKALSIRLEQFRNLASAETLDRSAINLVARQLFDAVVIDVTSNVMTFKMKQDIERTIEFEPPQSAASVTKQRVRTAARSKGGQFMKISS